ncbi:MAG: hypothetical protein MUC92_07510 [Fimbriimonadaceae bacterium]|jgi:hypothetical protein|nr:hypothetical protein [Fimbriimonadaceae bacterium]
MATIEYKPADVLHWFAIEARTSKERARRQGQEVAKAGTIVSGLRHAAGVALEYGVGTASELAQWQADETSFLLHDSGFEAINLVKRTKIDYSKVKQIVKEGTDKFKILYVGGSLTLKPVAHLSAGRLKVPIGWRRNGLEVPFVMLIEELSARCGVEIEVS